MSMSTERAAAPGIPDVSPSALDEYQRWAARGISRELKGDVQGMVVLGCMGLAGESGEVVDHCQKAIFHPDKRLDVDGLILELGDVLWYVALLCTALGVNMQGIADENRRKLEARYPERYCGPEPEQPAPKRPIAVCCVTCGGVGTAVNGDRDTVLYRCKNGHEWVLPALDADAA